MLEAIKRFFGQNLAPPPPAPPTGTGETHGARDRLALAACALLLELAHADNEFTEDERRHIEETLTHHFAMSAEAVSELIRLADEERQRAVDLYQFTSLITANYDEGQRLLLAEVMWRLVYADGSLTGHESYLMRKLSNLLELRPGYLAEARSRALSTGPD
ncbi:MAG: TerB family tellurite resistance protein [Gemmatimonadota bacterium]|nr:TerB family tellurite resistance protein [Gemmatimonadota bacterium]MDH3368672.1 TerB family tellurite resistance protein [Gemmatimonadota bacterium]MDH3477871.1 TerB family tellurite resistance protein [Gemmatimonadota bacterium]MDH3568665.1 TerB family tellurite resistance protein [Gemmatimonadota bacterium]MDH5549083.1 TerB family tellurite resistance protein [Gemmatimonadota bacterium]